MSQKKDTKAAPQTDAEETPFLSRWSQRKQQSRAGLSPETLSDDSAQNQLEEASETALADTQAIEESDSEKSLSDEALCEKYELVHPDKCETPEQLDSFFTRPLPDRIRQLAMRRMWRINPLFRFADEMVEYGEDFTDAATVIPDMATAYKVGKGYFDKLFVEHDEDASEIAETAPENGAEPRDEPIAETDSQKDTEMAQSEVEEKAEIAQKDNSEQRPELVLDKGEADSGSGVVPSGAENSQIQQDLAHAMPRSDSPDHAKDEAFDAPKQPPRRMVFTRNS